MPHRSLMIPHSVCLLYQRKMPQTVCDLKGGYMIQTAFWLPNRCAFQDNCILLPQNSSAGKTYCWNWHILWRKDKIFWLKCKMYMKFKSSIWEIFPNWWNSGGNLYLIFSSLSMKCIMPNFWKSFVWFLEES